MEPATGPELLLACLKAAAEACDEGFLVATLDMRVMTGNRGAARTLALSEPSLPGTALRALVAGRDRKTWDRCWESVFAGNQVTGVELSLRTRRGTAVPVRLSAVPVRLGDGPVMAVSMVFQNLTEQHLAQETLALNAARVAESEALAQMGSWAWDATSGAVQWSAEQHRIHGLSPGTFSGTLEAQLAQVHPEDRRDTSRALKRALLTGAPLERHFRVVRPDGSVRWIDARASRVGSKEGGTGLRGIYHDVTESYEHAEVLRASNARLSQLALYDDLTGLPNRVLFLERAHHAFDSREPRPLVICFLDLDDFKSVNDTLGHRAGDDLLRCVGERVSGCLRPVDTAARLSGDEFAVLFEDTTLEEATEIAQRILQAIGRPMNLEGTDVLIHTSIGLASTFGARSTPERLLAEADAAVYAAKARGGHRCEVFAPSMRVASEHRSRARSEIDSALQQEEFRLEFQPIMDVRTAELHGVEALIRWQHPRRGYLLPSDFIQHAEASGQITALDRWVLEQACHHALRLPPDAVMSVNLSARQLQEPDLVDFVSHALSDSGFPATRLVLEITETAAVADVRATIARLTELGALGLKIALDDFGTGYSPLNHLRGFPVDYLKIDQSFVRGLHHGPTDRAIVRGVIDLAHALGLRTIAEGVESEAQRQVLQELGCGLGQGFLWSPARPGDHFDSWRLPVPRGPVEGQRGASRKVRKEGC